METILNPTNPQPAPLPPRVRARLEAVRNLIDGVEDAAREAVDLIDGILLEDCAAERELSDLAPAQSLTEKRRD